MVVLISAAGEWSLYSVGNGASGRLGYGGVATQYRPLQIDTFNTGSDEYHNTMFQTNFAGSVMEAGLDFSIVILNRKSRGHVELVLLR